MSPEAQTFLDVNAAAGELNQLFSLDVTQALFQCDWCERTGPLAESYVYATQPGLIVRCNGCKGVLIRVVTNRANVWADLRGLRYVKLSRNESE